MSRSYLSAARAPDSCNTNSRAAFWCWQAPIMRLLFLDEADAYPGDVAGEGEVDRCGRPALGAKRMLGHVADPSRAGRAESGDIAREGDELRSATAIGPHAKLRVLLAQEAKNSPGLVQHIMQFPQRRDRQAIRPQLPFREAHAPPAHGTGQAVPRSDRRRACPDLPAAPPPYPHRACRHVAAQRELPWASVHGARLMPSRSVPLDSVLS